MNHFPLVPTSKPQAQAVRLGYTQAMDGVFPTYDASRAMGYTTQRTVSPKNSPYDTAVLDARSDNDTVQIALSKHDFVMVVQALALGRVQATVYHQTGKHHRSRY